MAKKKGRRKKKANKDESETEITGRHNDVSSTIGVSTPQSNGKMRRASSPYPHVIGLRTIKVSSTWKYWQLNENLYTADIEPEDTFKHFDKCNCLHSWKNTLPCGSLCSGRSSNTECRSSMCVNGKLCTNMRIQKREYAPGLERFMTSNKGWGVHARQGVAKCGLILEYTGEICSTKECERRMLTSYKENNHNYCLAVDDNTMIDATRAGSECRYVNHSCAPNCVMERWSVDGLPRMAIFALRDILPGEEICYDYKFSRINPDQAKKCFCGARECRGVIGGQGKGPLPQDNVELPTVASDITLPLYKCLVCGVDVPHTNRKIVAHLKLHNIDMGSYYLHYVQGEGEGTLDCNKNLLRLRNTEECKSMNLEDKNLPLRRAESQCKMHPDPDEMYSQQAIKHDSQEAGFENVNKSKHEEVCEAISKNVKKELEAKHSKLDQLCKEKENLEIEIDLELVLLNENKQNTEGKISSISEDLKNLIVMKKKYQDQQMCKLKEINEVDLTLAKLQKKKDDLVAGFNRDERSITECESKRCKLETLIEQESEKSMGEEKVIISKIEDLNRKLSINVAAFDNLPNEVLTFPPPKPVETTSILQDFIEREISDKEDKLECPICLEVANIPIYMCQEMHLICPKCRPKVKECPECREVYESKYKRHRYAEMMAEELARLKNQRKEILGSY